MCIHITHNPGSSVLLEMKHLLDDVKHQFSQVLLPVDSITKQQGLLGKGQ